MVTFRTRGVILISICCIEPKPDFQEFSDAEKKIFCRMGYLLRKRGYSIPTAQKIAYQQVLEESIPFKLD
jgi:hypothetical protein